MPSLFFHHQDEMQLKVLFYLQIVNRQPNSIKEPRTIILKLSNIFFPYVKMIRFMRHWLQNIWINFSNQCNVATLSFSLIPIIIIYFKISYCYYNTNNDDDLILQKMSIQNNCILIYCSIPLFTSILSYVFFVIQRQRKLSSLYDMNGNKIKCYQQLPQFLPEKEESISWNKIYDKLKNNVKELKQMERGNKIPTSGWALVTGASRGIGRAIAIELARYKIPVILVARDETKLNKLSMILEECYGVATKVIISDFSKIHSAEELWSKMPTGLQVDMFIHNAGIGDVNEMVHMDLAKIQDIITINLITGSKLCKLFGLKMKERRRGRIVVISSIAGAVQGVPTAAIYAATKAFQRSFCSSIGTELESYGVGVTCMMPGAVNDTNFALASNMKQSLVWKFPVGLLTAPTVASSVVKAMISGHPAIVVGWLNVICIKHIFLLLPARIVLLICRIAWDPPPFSSKHKND